jgi:hypothetical protein
MRRRHLTLAVALLATTTALISPPAVLAQQESLPDDIGLSPYWDPDVSRWEPIILQYAQQLNTDPDLIASVIWKESLGRPREHGPAGAVGLMGVMPFEWRPSAEELENPWTNLFWGTRALALTTRKGGGDLYYSLAAYNGGWGKSHQAGPRRYAASVLDHYVRAIAMRYELPTDGEWIAILAVEGAPNPNTITVIGPQRPLARYTERCWVQADIPTVPVGVPPHATAITFVNELGVECRVNVWLASESGALLAHPAGLIPPTAQSSAAEIVYNMQGPGDPPRPLKGIP